MFTQQFRLFRDKSSLISLFLSLLAVFVLLLGCEAEEGQIQGDPARTPSALCDPPCSGSSTRGCFFEDDSACADPPCTGCFERNCPEDNPIQSCSPGAVCQNGVCGFETTCSPECKSGQHCVYDVCTPNYTDKNVCDPLESCRNQCGPRSACLAACEQDRESSCRNCIDDMRDCERREGEASATGACSTEYCKCFPSASGCGGKPCANCWDQCGGDIGCFNVCASGTAACATCLQPFNAREDCKVADASQECEDLFYGCIE